MESYEQELNRFWVPRVEAAASGTTDAMQLAVDHLRRIGGGQRRIGIERAFLPADAEALLRSELPQAEIVEALVTLERLRARKTPPELKLLREASDRVRGRDASRHRRPRARHVEARAGRGASTRGSAARPFVRVLPYHGGNELQWAPSDQLWLEGDILSLDSGGNYKGYIGDLCRMANFSATPMPS